MKKYTVTYERDEDGWWTAEIPAVQGVHSNGRTIAAARRRVRQALGAMLDDDDAADRAELVDDVRLRRGAREAIAKAADRVRAAETARRRAAETQREAAEAQREAARRMIDELGLGLRDVGELLAISQKSVKRLIAGAGAAAEAATKAKARAK